MCLLFKETLASLTNFHQQSLFGQQTIVNNNKTKSTQFTHLFCATPDMPKLYREHLARAKNHNFRYLGQIILAHKNDSRTHSIIYMKQFPVFTFRLESRMAFFFFGSTLLNEHFGIYGNDSFRTF